MKYIITEEQLKRLGTVHLLLAREIIQNPVNQRVAYIIGVIKANVKMLDDNTGTKLKETILNDLSLLQK